MLACMIIDPRLDETMYEIKIQKHYHPNTRPTEGIGNLDMQNACRMIGPFVIEILLLAMYW